MKNHDFFPERPASKPIIYAYSDTRFPGMLKVGYTERVAGGFGMHVLFGL